MYDYDGNGVLDQNDFECLAVRNTIMEGKGDWDPIKLEFQRFWFFVLKCLWFHRYEKNKTVMINLWQQIAAIADFDKNGEVDTEEFMGGVETACKDKAYDDLPEAFKFFIEAQFRTIDVDGKSLPYWFLYFERFFFAGDGSIGLEEFRFDCVGRMAYSNVEVLDEAFKRVAESDNLSLARYKDLYAQFLGNPDESCVACSLFGPLPEL